MPLVLYPYLSDLTFLETKLTSFYLYLFSPFIVAIWDMTLHLYIQYLKKLFKNGSYCKENAVM